MIDFNFCSPTKIYFGKGKEKEIGNILKERNAKKVLIIIGGSSARKSGLFDIVIDSLKDKGIDYRLLEGVRANPEVKLGNEGIRLAKEYQPDYLLAVGGGSVMDTAKYIGVGYYYDGDAFDFNLHKVKPEKALPLGVILTISASGSEMSTSCVMQDDETGMKSGFNDELNRPAFVIENPELTYSLPHNQTAFGIVDIIMHTLERYLQPSTENEPADRFAEGLMKSVIQAGKKVMEDPCDYEARAVLMLMSSLSHNGLTSIGKPMGMPVHAIEHALSGLYPSVAHGEGLAILWPRWARYYLKYDVEKFDLLAKNVFNSYIEDKMENGRKGISLMEEFFISLKIPHSFKELNIQEEIDVEALAKRFSNDGTRVVAHHAKPMDREVAKEIYQNCF
ncbi:MAG: iron-containing alcohol dehydrogenase [Bacilli bacterium]|nr:iron-containing alcohol dehydrogenase [Bacilli bacterium]